MSQDSGGKLSGDELSGDELSVSELTDGLTGIRPVQDGYTC